MKAFLIFTTLSALLLLTACGNLTHANLSTQDSGIVNRPTQSGLAMCNAFAVSTAMSGNVEHPSTNGTPDDGHLLMVVKQLDPSFMANANNFIQFYRFNYTLGANGAAQVYKDPNPLIVNIVALNNTTSQAITPAGLQAAGHTTTPFYVLISGTEAPWPAIEIDMGLNGAGQVGSFLIPQFDADPLTYKEDHTSFPALVLLHPFYSQITEQKDYISLAQGFCFNPSP